MEPILVVEDHPVSHATATTPLGMRFAMGGPQRFPIG